MVLFRGKEADVFRKVDDYGRGVGDLGDGGRHIIANAPESTSAPETITGPEERQGSEMPAEAGETPAPGRVDLDRLAEVALRQAENVHTQAKTLFRDRAKDVRGALAVELLRQYAAAEPATEPEPPAEPEAEAPAEVETGGKSVTLDGKMRKKIDKVLKAAG